MELTDEMREWIEANPAPPLSAEQARRSGRLFRAGLEQARRRATAPGAEAQAS